MYKQHLRRHRWAVVFCLSLGFLLPQSTFGLTAKPRIINGEYAPVVPEWMGRLRINLASSYIQCGATLISSSWLVSASHCFDDVTDLSRIDASVSLGTNDGSDFNSRVRIKNIYRHPEYQSNGRGILLNDIALLELDTPVANTPLPILPLAQYEALQSRDEMRIMGWGSTESEGVSELLRQAPIEFMSIAECNSPNYWNGSVTDNTLCAFSYREDNKTASCSGDSGGPLLRDDFDQTYLVGVVSYGAVDDSDNCRIDVPEVHTAVPKYTRWITNTIRILTVSGDTNLGLHPINGTPQSTLTLKNDSDSTIQIGDIAVSGANANTFQVDRGQCGSSLASNSECSLTLSASAAVAGEYSAQLRVDYGLDKREQFDIRVSVLPTLATSVALPGVRWFGDNTRGWTPEQNINGGLSFRSSDDATGSTLLAMVSGPRVLSFDGRSLGEAAVYDGINILLDGASVNWLRLDTETTRFTVDVPAGEHRVEFHYVKSVSEGSSVILDNMSSGENAPVVEPNVSNPVSSSGGAVGWWLLVGLAVSLTRFWTRRSRWNH